MDNLMFKFTGSIYRFETLANSKFSATTRAISKEQAINNFKSQAKSSLGYNNTAKIDLVGELYISYPQTVREIYKINRDKLYLIESIFDENEFMILNDNKVKYKGQYMSLEQAKYLKLAEDTETRWRITYENGNSEDITGKVKVSGSCVLFKDEDYLYDDSEGVYWKFGIPFADRIEEV